MSLAYLQQESTPIHPDSIWGLAWTSRNQIVSSSADGHLRVYDPTLLARPLHDIQSHSLAISSLSVSADGSRALTVGLDGTVALADLEEPKVLTTLETAREKAAAGENELPAYCGAIHPELKCWAWSGRSSKIAIRSIEDSEEILRGSGKVIESGKGKFGMDIQFSPDGQSLALAAETGHIVVIDVESQAVTATYTSHAMAALLENMADRLWLFSGSDDRRIVLHDVRAGSKTGASNKGEGAVAIMQGHQGWVLRLAAGPEGKLLGSGGADGLVKLWDVGQRACVSTSSSNGSVWAVAWQSVPSDTIAAGKQFAVAGDDRAVTLYRAAGTM